MSGMDQVTAQEFDDRWFVVRSLPHKEIPARDRLDAQDFHTFLPMMDRTIRHARRILNVKRAVFPRYLFVRFNQRTTQWRSINGTIGVERLVMRNGRPSPVKRGVVETLIESVGDDSTLQFKDPLKAGDRVRLLYGPFADQLGILQSMRADDRVRVLLSFLGGPIPVEVDRKSLAPADD
ncbi:MAG: transcription termination/antitermination NusG family protein [Pseudomonadota bacterium]